MKKMKFNLPYVSHGTPEKNNGTKVTETAGYIPAELQIRRLLEAGQRLDEWKADLFDFAFNEDVPDNYLPANRSLGFDPADATQHLRSFDQRYNAWRQEEYKKQKEAELVEKAENEQPINVEAEE